MNPFLIGRLNLSLRVRWDLWVCELWSGTQRLHLLLRWGRA